MSDLVQKILRDPIEYYPQATVACFDPTYGDLPRRQLDESRLVQYLEKLADAGAEAVLLGSSTGLGHLRTVEELEQWFIAGARVPLDRLIRTALLRPEDGVEANQRLVTLLKENDYPVVFIRPGSNLPAFATDGQIVENMRPLVEMIAAAGLAIGVYSIPDVSGVRLPATVAEKLVDLPGGEAIVAAKITEADYLSSTREYLLSPRLAKLKIVQGWDTHLAQALSEGPRSNIENKQRAGMTSGPMSFAVYQYIHILEAAEKHDWEELHLSVNAAVLLFRAMQDNPAKFADLQRAKFIMGLGLPLTESLEHSKVERVFAALEALPRPEDKRRMAKSLDLMQDGPYHERLAAMY